MGLLAIGVGEVQAARSALGVIDIGISTADIVLEAYVADKLDDTESGRKFLQAWNTFNLLYAATRVIAELGGVTDELIDAGTSTLSNKDLLPEQVEKIEEAMNFASSTKWSWFDGLDVKLKSDLNHSSELRSLFANDSKRDGLVESWKAVSKHADLRIKPEVLSKLDDIAKRGRGIDHAKLQEVLSSDLGDVLLKADGTSLGNILSKLDQPHVTGSYLDEISRRLKDYPELKKDLLDHPQWFETFDDILQNPGKYKEIISQGEISTGSALSGWANGYWWKNLRDLADQFDNNVVSSALKSEFKANQVVGQVTLEVTNNAGIKRTIRIDNLVFDDITGKYILADAKFTTKAKDWNTDWLSSCTENQSTVFPWFKSGNVKEIVIKATDSQKIKDLADINLVPDAKITFANTSLRIYGSTPNEQVIGTIVILK